MDFNPFGNSLFFMKYILAVSRDYFSMIDNELLYYTEVFLSLAMKLAGIVT